MNELRLILIVIGIAFIAGLYFISRRFSQVSHNPNSNGDVETRVRPTLDMNQSASAVAAPVRDVTTPLQESQLRTDLETSHFLDHEILRDYADEIDWDKLDDIDLEWLEDSLDRINYDQIMYELNQGSAQVSSGMYASGYQEPYQRSKAFISLKKSDAEKMQYAMSTAQHIQPLIMILHILASNGKQFSGEQLQTAFQAVGMQHGEMNLFHYYADPEKTSDVQHKQRIFSAANTTGSGVFKKDKLDTMHTPGITLLLQIPAPIDAALAFETWYKTAKSLADKLDGTLFDATKSRITKQSLNLMKDQASEYGLKLRFTHSPSIH